MFSFYLIKDYLLNMFYNFFFIIMKTRIIFQLVLKIGSLVALNLDTNNYLGVQTSHIHQDTTKFQLHVQKSVLRR